MDKRIVYKDAATGALYIVTPAEPLRRDESEADYLDRIGAHAEAQFQSAVTRVGVMHKDEFPIRRWRDAWEWNNGVSISLSKVKDIRIAELQVEAKVELAKTTDKFMELLQAGSDASVEGAKATELRAFIADPVSKVPDFKTTDEAEAFVLSTAVTSVEVIAK